MRSIPHELYVAVIVHISVTAVAYVNVNKYTLACYENLFVMMRSPCERLGVPCLSTYGSWERLQLP